MGKYLFRLPDVGEGVAEAEIVAWHVKPGDIVEEDQTLVDVMTDKATVDMTSPVSGKVIAIHGEVGQVASVGSVLVEFEVDRSADEPSAKTTPLKEDSIIADQMAPAEKVASKQEAMPKKDDRSG
ncbi:MAG: biotin/lipoyl-containing protein, partial [Caulobacterales bacterium]